MLSDDIVYIVGIYDIVVDFIENRSFVITALAEISVDPWYWSLWEDSITPRETYSDLYHTLARNRLGAEDLGVEG